MLSEDDLKYKVIIDDWVKQIGMTLPERVGFFSCVSGALSIKTLDFLDFEKGKIDNEFKKMLKTNNIVRNAIIKYWGLNVKTKYLINGNHVKNLKAWCKQKGLSVETFKQSIKRAKKAGSNECHPLGFLVIRL